MGCRGPVAFWDESLQSIAFYLCSALKHRFGSREVKIDYCFSQLPFCLVRARRTYTNQAQRKKSSDWTPFCLGGSKHCLMMCWCRLSSVTFSRPSVWLMYPLPYLGGSVVKNLLASAGSLDLIPGSEDPLAVMSAHSSVLAWRIPWPEEPSGLRCLGLQSVSHDWVQHSTQINDVCCFQPIPIRADHWEVKHHTHTRAPERKPLTQ